MRSQGGLFGDARSVGGGAIVVLLDGGDKRTQARDIKTAIALADGLEE